MNGVMLIMVRVDIDDTFIDELVKDLKLTKQDFKKFNRQLSKDLPGKLVKELRKLTPKDTGKTAQAWTAHKKSNNGFELINTNGDIITFLIQGTKPHLIEPKDKSVLMMQLPQSTLFAKFVNHPGYDPQIDITNLHNKMKTIIEREVGKIIENMLDKRLDN